MIGGFWPAVLAAVAAALLLNWFFTPPVHTWTIEAPQNILALLLFVTSAVTVSSVVHLAARRHALATDRSLEAGTPAGAGTDGARRRGHSARGSGNTSRSPSR